MQESKPIPQSYTDGIKSTELYKSLEGTSNLMKLLAESTLDNDDIEGSVQRYLDDSKKTYQELVKIKRRNNDFHFTIINSIYRGTVYFAHEARKKHSKAILSK